jgi:hypothetical protein
MKKVHGRPILGFFGGLFFGLAVALTLLLFGVLALNSIWLVIVPIAGVVLGLVLGFTAPFGRHRPPPRPASTPPPPAPAPSAPPPASTPCPSSSAGAAVERHHLHHRRARRRHHLHRRSRSASPDWIVCAGPDGIAAVKQLAWGYGLIEGPRAAPDGSLYFSDVQKGGVHCLRPDGTIEVAVPSTRCRRHAAPTVVSSFRRNVCHVRDGVTCILYERDDVGGSTTCTPT